MAEDDPDFSTNATPTLQQLATFHADELYSVDRLKRLENAIRNAHAEGATIASATEIQAAPALAEKKASLVDDGYDLGRKAIGWALSQLIAHLLGIEAPPDLFRNGSLQPQDSAIGQAIAKTVINGIAGTSTELVPGDEAATRFMGMLGHMTIQSWAEGILIEEFASLHGVLHPIEQISKLGEELINGMGLNRLARVAMRPLAHILVATPLDWKYKKQFRPTLLSEADIVKAFLRGDYTAGDAAEELARLGYSDHRQDMLLKNSMKWLSAEDGLVLVRGGVIGRDFVVAQLRAGGLDAEGAENAMLVAEGRRLENIHDDSVAAVKAAYVDRRITDSDVENFLSSIYYDDAERGAHEVAFRMMRDVNTKFLSATQAEACVVAGVLPIAAYREALTREGYVDEAVTALELLLETKLNAGADVEQLRKQKAADATKAAADKADAVAAKKADVEKARALAARGPISELERAAVRGLIPIDRVTAVLAAQYDADTVQIYVDDITQQRAAYLVQQAKAADVTKAAAVRHIDVGALQTAVLDDVLTLDQFRSSLTTLNFAPADIDILAATLQARKADLDAAKTQRADAAARAARKSIDLTRFEELVRRGHRSLSDYTALLTALGFDDASRAAMSDLLALKIADDQTAAAARAAVTKADPAKGLSLDQARRGVLLGVSTFDDFQRYLVVNKFTVDAQAVLLAELHDDVAQADAARAKRDATTAARVETRLPLATVERAARLGIVSPDVYQQRLVDAGYTADDVAIDMDLLVVEIADVQAQRAKAAAADAATTDRGLSLQQLATAVKLGASTIDDYRARAAQLGYAVDDVATLAAVLTDEVATVQAAQARHDTIAGQLTARQLSLSELDAAVKAGQMTIDAYTARLEALGFGADDAELLTTLLVLKLPPPAPTTS